MIKIAITTILFALFTLSGIAHATGIEIAVGGWSQKPSGDLAYRGENVSIADELRYDSEMKPFGRLKFETPWFIPSIYLFASPMEFSGDGEKGTNFTFGDTTITGNVPFTSKLTLDHYDVAFFGTIPFLKKATNDMLNIDLGINARLVDLKAEIVQTATGVAESKNVLAPIPMIYAGIQVKPVGWLSLEGEGRGITYSKNTYFDAIGRVKAIAFDHYFIAGGYRYQSLKIDYDDVKVNTSFGGPFAEIGIQF